MEWGQLWCWWRQFQDCAVPVKRGAFTHTWGLQWPAEGLSSSMQSSPCSQMCLWSNCSLLLVFVMNPILWQLEDWSPKGAADLRDHRTNGFGDHLFDTPPKMLHYRTVSHCFMERRGVMGWIRLGGGGRINGAHLHHILIPIAGLLDLPRDAFVCACYLAGMWKSSVARLKSSPESPILWLDLWTSLNGWLWESVQSILRTWFDLSYVNFQNTSFDVLQVNVVQNVPISS